MASALPIVRIGSGEDERLVLLELQGKINGITASDGTLVEDLAIGDLIINDTDGDKDEV